MLAQAHSVEEAKARRDRLAKMRSLLFHQEIKLKHLAKIKSKDYHRRAQRAAKAKVLSTSHGMLKVLRRVKGLHVSSHHASSHQYLSGRSA